MEYDEEKEAYVETKKIGSGNFYNYIYGGKTDWSGVSNYDGCSALSAAPTTK
jgi:hypothetical protein